MLHWGPWLLLLKQEWGDIDSCEAIDSDSDSQVTQEVLEKGQEISE